MPQTSALDWLVARPIAHRGLHDAAQGIVENTASAFAAAIAGGFAIECDAQITADEEVVVFHDETLERLTHSYGCVNARSAAEMQRLTIRNSKDRVQTLAELLAQVEGKVPLLIELKSHLDGNYALARRSLAALRDYRGPHCLMCFDPDIVEALRRQSPHTVRGLVANRDSGQSFAHLEGTQPHFISFQFRDLPFAPVTEFRQTGHPVISWTIRSADDALFARRYSDQITFEGFLPDAPLHHQR
ncbi:MAG: glycerophosphodiester phosphodiesterase family protein [Aestuariivirga sp.]